MTQPGFTQRPSSIPNGIFVLVVINGLVFAMQHMLGPGSILDRNFALHPVGYGFAPWQLLTYGFMHSTINLMHIVFNMFMLWMFGRELELVYGTRRFMTYYLTCVIGAGLVQLLVAFLQGGVYLTIGASGGVFGLLLLFGMTFPNRMIMLIFPPIPMRAKYMVVLFGIIELVIGLGGYAPGIAHFAHLGGMLFGFLLIQRWRGQARRR